MLKIIEDDVAYSNKIVNDLLEYSGKIKLEYVDELSHETVRQTLKKTNSNLG
jgi:glutaredoxin-related protein